MMKKFVSRISFLSLFYLILLTGCEAEAEYKEESLNVQALTTERPEQTVGVNYNGQFDFIDYSDLERTQTRWVRGFTDFFQLYPDVQKLHTDKRLTNYLELKKNGYKTILNIKWNFGHKSFPESGSDEMKNYKKFLRKLLRKVWMSTDIIVVGNEPFIESRKAERDERLVAFYTEIAKEINSFKKGQGTGDRAGKGVRDVPVYLGAFNNLYLNGWRTPAVEQMMAFAKAQSWIAGIDLHIHHSGIRQVNRAMNFANNRIRSDQRIIITEYSLMKHWGFKMEELIPEEFAAQYSRNPAEKNFQYIDYALKNQVPREEWVDFLSSSYWFENRTRYLWNSYQRLKSYRKFHVATYAMRQSFPFNRDFTKNTDPWVLNGLFANRTVKREPETRQNQFNYAWIKDFHKIQKDYQQN